MKQVFLSLVLVYLSVALENGLARTPPMGWMDWERFRCQTDCKKYPDDCIGEKLFTTIADAMVSGGFKDVGYEYIDIDDCWMARERKNGKLVADPERFPHGMKWLADYIHSKGLKLGIYSDVGTRTCGGYPASGEHLQTDAETFAEWGIDALKLDGCYANKQDYIKKYPEMSKFLNQTGRPIMYSCSWPAYLSDAEKAKWYPTIAENCNIWRNWADVQNSWHSVKSIIDYWGSHSKVLSAVARPGAFNDPDQVIIGDTGLNEVEAQTTMAMYAMMTGPLLMSNDLRKISDSAKKILQNTEVIGVNQDKLGKQGVRVNSTSDYEIWRKPLENGRYAVSLWNKARTTQLLSAKLDFFGGSASVRDLINHKNLGVKKGEYSVSLGPGATALVRLQKA